MNGGKFYLFIILFNIIIFNINFIFNRNRFKSFEVCMGFCSSERPESGLPEQAGPEPELGPPPPPHPGKKIPAFNCVIDLN